MSLAVRRSCTECEDQAVFVCTQCTTGENEKMWLLCTHHDRKFHSKKNTQGHIRLLVSEYQFIELVNKQPTDEEYMNDQKNNLFMGIWPSTQYGTPTLQLGAKYHSLGKILPVECELAVFSMIAPTGSGKSLLLRSFIGEGEFSDPSLPLAACHGPQQSTSADVHAYYVHLDIPLEVGSRTLPVLCLDSEGLRGTKEPLQARQYFKKLAGKSDRLAEMRSKMVAVGYPRLLYMFSDVIVYPFLGAISDGTATLDLLEFCAISSARTVNSSSLPSLIIVFNKRLLSDCRDFLQQSGEQSKDCAERATNHWRQHNPEAYDQLLLGFRKVYIVYVPDCVEHAQQARIQLVLLKQLSQQLISECVVERARLNIIQRKDRLFSNMWSIANQLVHAPNEPMDLFRRLLINTNHATLGDNKAQNLEFFWEGLYEACDRNAQKAYEILKSILPMLYQNRWNSVELANAFQMVRKCELGALQTLVSGYFVCTATKNFPGIGSVKCETTESEHFKHKSPKTYQTTQPSSVWYKKWFGGLDYICKQCGWDGSFVGSDASDLADSVNYAKNPSTLTAPEYRRALNKPVLLKIAKVSPNVASNICLVCVWNSPTVALLCGHSICSTCYERHVEQYRYECPLCGKHGTPTTRRVPKSAGIRVLSIDGGGVRGVISSIFLAQIEELTGYRIAQLFDIIVGTSVGGVLALYLTANNTTKANDGVALIKSNAVDIFGKPNSLMNKVGSILFGGAYSKYCSKKLHDVLAMNFRGTFDKPLRAYGKDNPVVAVTMVDVASQSLVVATSSAGSVSNDIGCYATVGETCIGTFSVPTYFDNFIINDRLYIDGGMLANCPACKAIDVSNQIWPSESVNVLVSVGTGRCTPEIANKGTLIEAIGVAVNLLTDSQRQANDAENIYNEKYPQGKFCRLNAELKKPYDLDTCNAKVIDSMIEAAKIVALQDCTEISGRLLAQMVFVRLDQVRISYKLSFKLESRLPEDAPLDSLVKDGVYYKYIRKGATPSSAIPLSASTTSINLTPGTYTIAFYVKTKFGDFPMSGSPAKVEVNPSLYAH